MPFRGLEGTTLSQAGRSVLVQFVAQALPVYSMQHFCIPKRICSKLDALIRDFWWGKKDDSVRHLYLTAWSRICSPKQAGGLGFRLCHDTNSAFMAKLAWEILCSPHKPWVQLIWARYLRGKKLLNSQVESHGASWVWRGIVANIDKVRDHICYKVGNPTLLHIWEDPWIPTLLHYRPPLEYKLAAGPLHLHELISWNGTCWDMASLSSLFPPSIIQEILKIHIPSVLEPDRLIWNPSPTGTFTVRSVYRMFSQSQFILNSNVQRSTWRALWATALHP